MSAESSNPQAVLPRQRAKRSLASLPSRIVSRASFPLFDRWDRGDRGAELNRLLISQYKSAEWHQANSLRKLNVALARAFEHVPYYRTQWATLPVLSSLADIRQLPILTKADIRGAGETLNSDLVAHAALLSAKTGGSTGTALIVRFDHRCQQHRNAAAMRSDMWAGWRMGDWTGALWGSPDRPTGFKQRLRNALRSRLEYLDTMRLDEKSMREFLQLMCDRPLDAIFGHAHSLFILADFKLRAGIDTPNPHAIVSTSMMLLASERATIERAFGCPVGDRYGCEEVGLIAAQCDRHESYHVNAEHTYVEIVNDAGEPCAPGEIGRVLVTDLENIGAPLVRYEVGDLSAWSMRACSCARGLPTLERVVGRQADCLQRVDGSLVAGVSLVERTLLAISGIAQLQLVQSAPRELTAYLVGEGQGEAAPISALTAALKADLGDQMQVQVEVVTRIPQEKNGKYRFAIRRF
jgi:phenylacetate-CoA ligase